MKKIKSEFKRNGLVYKLLDRTNKIALFSLTIADDIEGKEVVGYEVSKLYIKRDRSINGKMIEGSESLPTDDQFAFDDNSKSFFPNELDRAKEYLQEYTLALQAKTSSNRLTIMGK